MAAVKLTRVIDATPAVVYRAWLDPDVLALWAAPVTYRNAGVEVDERVGGRYRWWHVDDAGEDMGGFDAEILELEPEARIVLAWHFVGPGRVPLADSPSRLTITLRPVAGDRCELTLVHDRLDDLSEHAPDVADAVGPGWAGTLERLAARVA